MAEDAFAFAFAGVTLIEFLSNIVYPTLAEDTFAFAFAGVTLIELAPRSTAFFNTRWICASRSPASCSQKDKRQKDKKIRNKTKGPK